MFPSKHGLLVREQRNCLLLAQANALSPILSSCRRNCYGKLFRENNQTLPLENKAKLSFTFIIF